MNNNDSTRFTAATTFGGLGRRRRRRRRKRSNMNEMGDNILLPMDDETIEILSQRISHAIDQFIMVYELWRSKSCMAASAPPVSPKQNYLG